MTAAGIYKDVRTGTGARCAPFTGECLLELAAAKGWWYRVKNAGTGTYLGMEVRVCTGVELGQPGVLRAVVGGFQLMKCVCEDASAGT